uniref:Uncharacterized protein n=1 Tax=Cacopsylla melanoneura TaxID=428564 RepID=A0A8D8TZV0_9HEMI
MKDEEEEKDDEEDTEEEDQEGEEKTEEKEEMKDSEVDKEDLKIYYQNCNGLRTKNEEFKSNCDERDYDFIGLTETWLKENIHIGDYFSQAGTTRFTGKTGTTNKGVALSWLSDKTSSLSKEEQTLRRMK